MELVLLAFVVVLVLTAVAYLWFVAGWKRHTGAVVVPQA